MSDSHHAIHERHINNVTSRFLFTKLFTLSNAEAVSFEDAEAVETIDFLLPAPNLAVLIIVLPRLVMGVIQTVPPSISICAIH